MWWKAGFLALKETKLPFMIVLSKKGMKLYTKDDLNHDKIHRGKN